MALSIYLTHSTFKEDHWPLSVFSFWMHQTIWIWEMLFTKAPQQDIRKENMWTRLWASQWQLVSLCLKTVQKYLLPSSLVFSQTAKVIRWAFLPSFPWKSLHSIIAGDSTGGRLYIWTPQGILNYNASGTYQHTRDIGKREELTRSLPGFSPIPKCLSAGKETDSCHLKTESRNRDQNLPAVQQPFAIGNGFLK